MPSHPHLRKFFGVGRAYERIDLQSDPARHDWAIALHCTEDNLREAVAAVGESAGKVEIWLDDHHVR